VFCVRDVRRRILTVSLAVAGSFGEAGWYEEEDEVEDPTRELDAALEGDSRTSAAFPCTDNAAGGSSKDVGIVERAGVRGGVGVGSGRGIYVRVCVRIACTVYYIKGEGWETSKEGRRERGRE